MTAYPDHDEALGRALARLVDQGLLDAALAERIERERDLDAAEMAGAADLADPMTAAHPPVPARTRLPEVLGYLGGAFVAVAGLLVLGRFWRQLGLAVRVGLTLGGAVALAGGGLVIAAGASVGWRGLRAGQDTARRRLVGVLVLLAAPLAALTLGQILDDARVETVLLPSALVALAVCLVAVWIAPGVVPTLGLFVSAATTVAGVNNLFTSVPTLSIVLGILVAGLGWTTLAPRLSGAALVATSLGLLTLVGDGFGAAQYTVQRVELVDASRAGAGYGPSQWGARAVAPVGYAILFGVAAVGVTVYLRAGPWPWIAGAGLACAGFVGAYTGSTLGPVAAFFAAGLVLLAVSAVLLLRRGRRRGPPVTPGR